MAADTATKAAVNPTEIDYHLMVDRYIRFIWQKKWDLDINNNLLAVQPQILSHDLSVDCLSGKRQ
jgi:hypothetical protein